ncbi:MAG: hypothetical protein A2Y73_05445 [Chloroflexi bacterium RBG_13_56_8]|nr:MAG: hypothetical protein A2Y73_05445 [Chloroflexi bacterium RBG_13_56_8]
MLAIETNGLTRDYGELRAVDHLDLAVRPGEVYGFLGPNGAGKTTTIRLLTGLIRPTSGSAAMEGLDVSRNPLEIKARVGVVPERSNLYGELSARDNLIFVAKLYGLSRKEWRPRAEELLAQFGLSDRAHSLFGALSGGMKRRLTIAAALVHRPSILFLDEPTTGLDVHAARSLRQTISRLHASGVTIFLTTHLIAEAEPLCDRVGIVVKGKLVAEDTPAALCERCLEERRLELDVASPTDALMSALRRSPEVTALSREGDTLRLSVRSVDAVLPDVVAAAREGGAEIQAVRTVVPTLEDAFVRLTGIDVETLESDKPRGMRGGAS